MQRKGSRAEISKLGMLNGTNARMCGMYARRCRDSRVFDIGVAASETMWGLEAEMEGLGVGYLIRGIQYASTRQKQQSKISEIF